MGAYENLAVSYDRLTNDVDYEATVAFYNEILNREGIRPRTAVDLACGTGSVTKLLAQQGLQITGVDMSEEMLTVAMEKCMDMDNPPGSSASLFRSCGFPEVLIWRCALWTVWTMLPTRLTVPRPSGGSSRR